ncbi:MAG: hypothetical protein WB493_13105 [Anaeromyxobacteraceae bacterium]
MFKILLLCVLALTVVACAGPMTSTAVLQDRSQDGGTVRILCPGYPPDADTQAKASAEMAKVCDTRRWKVVDIKLTDIQHPRHPECLPGYPCYSGKGPWQQQVDLKFVCVAM